MQPLPPEDHPITGLCVVSDPTKCPPGYEVIYRSHDKKDDCDLWKDSIFKSKVTRYLCFTRVFPLEGGHLNNVLADIVLNMEREPPPTDFNLVDFTIDTREKATRKKQICVKMLPRSSCQDAICELILLSRSKRPPTGYTLAGEMNGLLICFKMGAVPPETQNSTDGQQMAPNDNPSYPVEPYMNSLNSPQGYGSCVSWGSPQRGAGAPPHPYASPFPWSGPTSYAVEQPVAAPVMNSVHGVATNHNSSMLTRQDSLLMPGSALSGVPFQINPKLQDLQSLKSADVPEIQFRSIVDIENEFGYQFQAENAAATRIPTGLE